MKIFFSILFFHLIYFSFSQDYLIELKNIKTDIEINHFYIEKVIDNRYNKNLIGFVKTGVNTDQKANFNTSTDSAISDYLHFAYEFDTTGIPVTLIITDLWISEEISFLKQERIAEISVEFYRKMDNKEVLLFKTTEKVVSSENDVSSNHEKRIREAIDNCIYAFNNDKWELISNENPFRENNTNEINPTQDKEIKVKKKGNFIFVNLAKGISAEGFGLTYSYFIQKKDNSIILPISFTLEQFVIYPNKTISSAYSKGKLDYFISGFSFYKAVQKKIYTLLNINLLIGNETLTNLYGKTSDYFVLGVNTAQGIYFIPVSKYGIIAGIGLYEKFLTSKIYPFDLGLKFEVGIKF